MADLREQYERETGKKSQTGGGILYRQGYVAWLERRAACAEELAAALQALADKADATGDCDHKRASCEEVGCIGEQVRNARAALAAFEAGNSG